MTTLTIDEAMLKEVIVDFCESIKDNEDVKALLKDYFDVSEINSQEIADDLDMDGKIVVKCFEYNNECIAVTMEAISDYDNRCSFEIKCYTIDDNVNIIMGDKYDIIEIVYTLNNGNELLEITNEYDYGDGYSGSDTLLQAKGTYKNGVHKGTISFDDDVKFDYELKATDSSFKVGISNIEVDGEVYDCAFSIEASVSSKKISYKVDVEIDYEGLVVDASAELILQKTELTIKAPKNYTSIDDIDESDLEAWLEEAEDEYPNIFELLELFTVSRQGSSESFDDDYYYEY